MTNQIRLLRHVARITGAGLLLALASPPSAQTVKPLLGKLVVKVPAVLLPSDDYWIYVNSQIVSAPPYKSSVGHNTYMHVGAMIKGGPDQFWDRDGHAATSSDGKMTFIRANVREGLFQSKTLQLAPGNYKVELVTRSINGSSFPFAIATGQAKIVVGTTVTLEFGYPTGTNEFGGLVAARAVPLAPRQVNELIKSTFAALEATQKRFADDEVVKALNKTLQSITLAPPSQPGVYVSIPDSLGGARELDARLITFIVDALRSQYSMGTPSELVNATGESAQLAGLVVDQIADHNKRIGFFLEISKALEKVKQK